MSKVDTGLKWLVYISGGVAAITTVCVIVGVLLEEIWGINTLYGFYDIVARMFVISMILCLPIGVSSLYLLRKSRKAKS